jgi:hypothetical protein
MCMLTPFLQYVSEARIIRRQDDLTRYTYGEIEERIYLSFLSLALLNRFNSSRAFVRQYANDTLTYGSFDRVRTTANDLHNMLAVVDGNVDILRQTEQQTAGSSDATATSTAYHGCEKMVANSAG